jgi:hypothetical protein
MSKSKYQDLTPWLDYLDMLQWYEQEGFLQMNPKEHEAYITRAALLTLAGIDAEDVQSAAISSQPEALADTLSRLRAYAAYRWAPAVGQQHATDMNDPAAPLPAIPEAELTAYLSQPFAIHIVKEDYPHDLLLTLLLQQKRSWRTAWRTVDTIEAIDYTEQKSQEK